jgi:hypothetical protein
MADVDISDILLAIARQVSHSLEAAKMQLQPTRFQNLLQGIGDRTRYGLLLFYIGLWWRNYAVGHRVEHQQACDRARDYL